MIVTLMIVTLMLVTLMIDTRRNILRLRRAKQKAARWPMLAQSTVLVREGRDNPIAIIYKHARRSLTI